MNRNRRLTKEELALWKQVTANVDRLVKGTLPAKPKPAEREDATPLPRIRHAPRMRQESTGQRPASLPPLDPHGPVNTDRRTFERLKRGKMPIESRLDLHGRTQLEAHDALDRFLTASAARGYRCVLIVTGKGVDGHGVLRQMVPRWLAEHDNRNKVITFCQAQPRHGGVGALYVLLKRRRA